eukprot:GEMP01053221.1.p1 GENE.GEMP01053221.1~~GEMP01053221.1.p1  ORF type:complete len:164 (+),score=38.96 GEMP01053221.1:55-546(+)
MQLTFRRMTSSIKKVVKQPTEWAEKLTKEEFDVLRNKGTEPPRTGEYDKFYPTEGYFKCKACDFPLYSAKAKFDSGCGWPAYNACYHSDAGCHVQTHVDNSIPDRERVEIVCAQCEGHLGHVFHGEKGPKTERHCVNSVSVKFVKAAPTTQVRDDAVVVNRNK